MYNAKALQATRKKSSTIVNRKVPPLRLSNKRLRPREYLKPDEVETAHCGS